MIGSEKKSYKVISLFSGIGGLDLGFKNTGFEIVYANDKDSKMKETYEKNLKHELDVRSIIDVPSEEIPDADGVIGGPPCQSWSLAGAMRGINDKRGKLFYEYIRVLKDKKPLFFVAENVPGIVSKTHLPEFEKIIEEFEKIGYYVSYKTLNTRDFGVPQDRKRVIIVGFHKSLKKKFKFPSPTYVKKPIRKGLKKWVPLKKAIGDLPKAKPAKKKNDANDDLQVPNHEYMTGGFSYIYMSRNRRKDWNELSYTIQAGGRHAPLHPDSCKMIKVGPDERMFEGKNKFRRRLSVRECARIQTFPDNFIFYYDRVNIGYKMVGNAVPVKFAEAIAKKIIEDLQKSPQKITVQTKLQI